MDSLHRDHSPAGGAGRELARLDALIAERHEVLAALQQELAAAESALASAESARIVEVNEQLVLAALRSQSDADTAAQALEDAALSAQLDPLTGLPNRTLLRDRLDQSLAHAKRHGSHLALLFLDLNDFKGINDTLGHAAGDDVLRTAAQRLAACMRGSDSLSRHGGDEFVVLLSEVSHASDAAQVAAKMVKALAAPMRIGAEVLRLTVSIGVSIYPDDAQDADALVDRADAAMYRAKGEGPGSFVFRGDGAAAERLVHLLPGPSLRRPPTRLEKTIAEHERRVAELREANEKLVLAALDAEGSRTAMEGRRGSPSTSRGNGR